MIAFVVCALSMPPQAPPVSREEFNSIVARVEALERLVPQAPKVVPAKSLPAPMVEAAKKDWDKYPTYHYGWPQPNGTVMVRTQDGRLIPSQAPTHISYPGGGQPQPIQQAVPVAQPVFYQQPFAFGGQMQYGEACVGRS
jgi:hypothetical protein